MDVGAAEVEEGVAVGVVGVVEVGAAEPIGTGAVVRIPLTVVIPPGSPTANHLGSEQAPSGRIVLATGLPDSPIVSLPVSVVIGP